MWKSFKKYSALMLVVVLCASLIVPMSRVEAAFGLTHEGFDYTGGTALNTTAASGGWSTGWKADSALSTSLDTSYTVSANQNLSHLNTINMYRGLTTPINLNIDQDYYFSWKMQVDDPVAANTSSIRSRLWLNSNTFFGMAGKDATSGNLQFNARFLGTNVNGPDVVKGQLYTVVVKIAAKASGNDNAYMRIYGPGETVTDEPVSGGWDITVSGASTASYSALGFEGNLYNASGKMTFDQLNAGARWMDVKGTLGFNAKDNFDYATNTLMSTTTRDGGWSTGWKANSTLTTDLDSTYKALASSAGVQRVSNTSFSMYRGLNAPLDLTVNKDYYLSYKINVADPAAVNASVNARLTLDSSNFFGLTNKNDGTSSLRFNARFQGTNVTGPDVVKGQTYTIVVKISAVSAGNDTAYMKIYGPSDVISYEPSTWDITIAKAATNVFSSIGLTGVLYANGTILFDNARVGSSWYDITGIQKFKAMDWFNYAAGTKLNTTTSDGGLWSSGWKANNTLTTSLANDYVVSSVNDVQRNGSLAMYRGLLNPVNLNADNNYYFSWKMQVDDPVAADLTSKAGLSFDSNNFFGMTPKDATSGNLQFSGKLLGTQVNGPDVVKGQTYTIVVKIAASATGNDQAFMQIFGPGHSVGLEPSTWDIIVSGNGTSSFSSIGFDSNLNANGLIKYDQFNIGSTFADVSASEVRTIGETLFNLIDLTRSELSSINSLVQAQDYEAAVNAYHDFFIDKLSAMNLGDPECGSACSTTLEQAMNNQVTVINQPVGTTTNTIGTPGNIDWFFISPDGNTAYSLLVAGMSWTKVLTNQFAATGDSVYSDKWNAYWDDFATNNYNQWFDLKNSPDAVNYPGLNDSWNQRLYLADRNNAFMEQLSELARANPTKTKQSIPAIALAKMLNLMTDKGFDLLVTKTQPSQGGAPNQLLTAGVALVRSSVGFAEFKNAQSWYIQGQTLTQGYIDPVTGTMMRDGSDLEQSLNYNIVLLRRAEELRNLFPGTNAPQWVVDYPATSLARFRFMVSLVRPTGNLPGLDKMDDRNVYINWEFPKWQAYYNDDTTGRIINNVFLNDTNVQPAFKSIYFPYGGYVAMRSGWDLGANYLFMKTSRRGSGHVDEAGNAIQVAALGKTMLIDSGPTSYYALTPEEIANNEYLESSLSHNTIMVDNKTQLMIKTPAVNVGYSTPISARWSTSDSFDFAEGNFSSGYGTNMSESSPSLTDVTHDRQTLYVKELGAYVVTDRMNTANSHSYSQNWNLDSSYAVTDVVYGSNMIKTQAATGPNVELYNFSSQALTYTGYTGKYRFRPDYPVVDKQDLRVTWSGTGNQLVTTLINPINGTTTDIQSINRISDDVNGTIEGFDAFKTNGKQVQYRAALNKNEALTIGNISFTGEALLVTTDGSGNRRGIALGATALTINGVSQTLSYGNFEFELQGDTLQSTTEVKVPTNFQWEDTGSGLAPVYE